MSFVCGISSSETIEVIVLFFNLMCFCVMIRKHFLYAQVDEKLIHFFTSNYKTLFFIFTFLIHLELIPMHGMHYWFNFIFSKSLTIWVHLLESISLFQWFEIFLLLYANSPHASIWVCFWTFILLHPDICIILWSCYINLIIEAS